MAHVEESGTGRKTNVDVNIVPFIDLMSVLVIFLLITAVWTQVSMIQIGSSVYGKASEDPLDKPPPKAQVILRVDVKPNMYRVVTGPSVTRIPKTSTGDYDTEKLLTELEKFKEIYPDKTDAVISVGDELEYNELIKGMDALLQAGFPEIAIATAEVE